MDSQTAIEFLRPAIDTRGGTWADFGAGGGTFTRALAAILGPDGRVLAIDRDPAFPKRARNMSNSQNRHARIVTAQGDFTQLEVIPRLSDVVLDGAVFANALHFVPDPERVLSDLHAYLHPEGRLVIIEYEEETANRWVPYPLPVNRLTGVVINAGFTTPNVVARRPSRYRGAMYCAVATRLQ